MDEKEQRAKSRAEIVNQWIILIAFICILVGGSVISVYIVIHNINSCTAYPDRYLAKRINEEQNLSYEYAVIYFYINEESTIAAESVEIDLTD